MGIGLSGGLGPFRAGVSTRGGHVGAGPLSVGGRWPGGRRRSPGGRRRRSGGGGGGDAFLLIVFVLVLFWPFLVGMWVSAKFGGSEEAQVTTGWVFEGVYVLAILGFVFARFWKKRAEAELERQHLATQEAQERVKSLEHSLEQAHSLKSQLLENPTGKLVKDAPAIRRGELQICELSDVWLVEQRSAHRGGPKVFKRVSSGSAVFTDLGICFNGPSKTVKWKFEKVLSAEQDEEYLVFAVTNRQQVSGIASDVQDLVELAYARARSVAIGNPSTDVLTSVDGLISSIETELTDAEERLAMFKTPVDHDLESRRNPLSNQ